MASQSDLYPKLLISNRLRLSNQTKLNQFSPTFLRLVLHIAEQSRRCQLSTTPATLSFLLTLLFPHRALSTVYPFHFMPLLLHRFIRPFPLRQSLPARTVRRQRQNRPSPSHSLSNLRTKRTKDYEHRHRPLLRLDQVSH